jgi:quinol monooxygenase YgiN
MIRLLQVSALALLLSIGQAAAQNASEIYVVTHVDFTPPNAALGEAALKAFAVEAGKDAVRYEVLQEPTRKNHFTLVTVWKDQAAFDAHLASPKTREFRNKIDPLLGSPFDERLHRLDQ